MSLPTRVHHSPTQVYIVSQYTAAEFNTLTRAQAEEETGLLLAGLHKADSEGLSSYSRSKDGISLPPRPGTFV